MQVIQTDQNLLKELKQVVQLYLEQNPRLSVNALSKRSDVSEATLRRILKDQIKTEPCGETVLEVLIAITKENKISELVKRFPGVIAEKLKETFGVQSEQSYQFVPQLESELSDEISYLVYKLSANTNGVSLNQVKKIFGIMGLEKLEKLIEKNLIEKRDDVFHAVYKSFALGNQVFVKNFKACSQFINVSKNRDVNQNLFFNLSESISKEAYNEILKIQKQALKKISQVVNLEQSKGDIPFFMLTSVDRFDHKVENNDQIH